TSTLYYVFTRLITLDMAVSVFVTGALLSFLLAQKSSPGPKRRWLMYACSLSFALGFLTKGAMSIAIPGGVMFLWVLIFNRWSKLLPLYLPTSLVLFLTIATPWHVLVALKNPEFLWFYFVNEHVLRYLTTTHNRYGPIWYFIPVILLGLLPWTAFLPQAIKDLVRKYRQDKQAWEVLSYLFLWAGLIFVFFSISSSKLVPYILPLFPALALIMGRFFASIPGTALQPIKKSLWGYLGLNLFLAGVLSFVLFGTDLAEPEHWTYACFVIGVWILSALVVPLLGRLRGVRGVFEGMVGTAVCFFMIASVAAPTLQKRSIKPIAEQIKQNFPPHTIVANYHTYNQDLPVYLDRTIKVVGWTGELQFGMEQEDTSDWMWDEVTFWENWAKEETMCMVTNKGYYEQIKENPNIHFLLVTENQGDYLVCNRKKDAQ
ncbi:MAG: hypothetical protein HOK20_05620, partial [Alphaproteobacteria bacterium]|nr:hypothetical protein [Alphaproteobacteria bacterium]